MEAGEWTIQAALLSLLKDRKVETPPFSNAVRVFRTTIDRSSRYSVIVYPPIKSALCEVLNFLSGGQEDEAESKAGIWVLTESQAEFLRTILAASDGEFDDSPRILGQLLYVDKAQSFVSEQDWIALIQSITAGGQRALYALYERTHRVVFTLVLRIINNREIAEELTLDVFHYVWRHAWTYDSASASVLGWVLSHARSRAIDRLHVEQRKKGDNQHPDEPALSALIDPFVSSPTVVPRPSPLLRQRLAQRIATETKGALVVPSSQHWKEPQWKEVAAGICCKLLATDTERHRVSMLVRLAPEVDYPPHTHAAVEELHLLHGTLWINDRKLYPGDYNRAEAGTPDNRVRSDTGCTCVLITSLGDLIN